MNAVKSAALAISLVSTLGLSAPAIAAPQTTVMPAEVHRNLPPTPAVLHKMLGVYISQGAYNGTIPAGVLTPINAPLTFKCTQTKGCTVVIANDIQYAPSADGGMAAVCTEVDGNYTNNCGAYAGTVHPADGFAVVNDLENIQVATGTHTIQTFGFLGAGGYVYNYEFNYTITTP